VARNKGFDPDGVLESALQVFWRHGYEATSINDLVEQLGIGRASLYATYGSKHQLYLRALDRYVQAKNPAVVERLSQPGPVLPAVRELVESYVEESIGAAGQRGCLVVNAAIERLPGDSAAARLVQSSWCTLEVALTAALTRARAQGELARDKDPRALAGFLLVVLQGLRVLGKSDSDPGRLAAAGEQALAVLR
jgi:TetR/AcrR family transcriptional regulator, transcriptional repressor for nem operon